MPWLCVPRIDGVDLAAWLQQHRSTIEEVLSTTGAVLFRGFKLDSEAVFEEVVRAISSEMLDYVDRTSPRSQVRGKVYTSTDFPPEHSIALHNENSYSHIWPRRIFFHCMKAARRGGATPTADSREVLKNLDPDLVSRFREKGVRYVRNFGQGLGLPWQETFQTTEPREVESYCQEAAIEWRWLDDGCLRTWQNRPAVINHPETGEPLWFNQVTLFHVAALAPEVRGPLLEQFTEEELPSHVYFGDGTPIDEETVREIQRAYDRATHSFPWQEGDLLLLDNMLVAHGRDPFEGPRKVVVAMSDPLAWHDV